MAQRKSNLLPILLPVLGLIVLGVVGYMYYWVPYQNYNNQIADWNSKIDEKLVQIIQVQKEKAARDRFEMTSLPTNVVVARLEYQRYLMELAKKYDLQVKDGPKYNGSKAGSSGAQKSQFGGKKDEPAYNTLLFQMTADATLGNFTKMLKEFEDTPLMHRVLMLTLKPDPEAKKSKRQNEYYPIQMVLDVEAVIVEGADKRSHLLLGPDEGVLAVSALMTLANGPGGFPFLPWALGTTGPLSQPLLAKAKIHRNYSQITEHNIFVGYREPEKVVSIKPTPKQIDPPKGEDENPKVVDPFPNLNMLEFYKLVSITKSEEVDEAYLYCVLKNQYTRLKASPAFKYFAIYNGSGTKTLVKGMVLKIDYGAVYFEANKKVYAIHTGETMEEALQQVISAEEQHKAGLKVVMGP